MKGPFGRDGFLGEMDRWWLYNKMREEQEQAENDDLDLDDDDLFDSTTEINKTWDTDDDNEDDDEDFTAEELAYLRSFGNNKSNVITAGSKAVEKWNERLDEKRSGKTSSASKDDDGYYFDDEDIETDLEMLEKYPQYRAIREKQIAQTEAEKDKEKALAEWNKKLAEKQAAREAYNNWKAISERKARDEQLKKQAEQNSTRHKIPFWSIFWRIAVILSAILGWIIFLTKPSEESDTRTSYKTKYNYRTTTTTYRTTTTRTSTARTRTTARRKTTTKDEFNVNDYNDPEDFYEDNYDDFWDYEDAEDYYREHHK